MLVINRLTIEESTIDTTADEYRETMEKCMHAVADDAHSMLPDEWRTKYDRYLTNWQPPTKPT